MRQHMGLQHQMLEYGRPKMHSNSEQEMVLNEIKTCFRILNTWGNVLVPNLDGKEVTAQKRLGHFIQRAQKEFGMSIDEIEAAIV